MNRYITVSYYIFRNLFAEMRFTVMFMCNSPRCPQFVRALCTKSLDLVSRLAPAVAGQ